MNIQNDISVILPVYNGGKYLQSSVMSVLNQNFKSFDFFILDDNSDDGSYEWLVQLEDERIVLLRNQTNKGLFHNLNLLILRSETPLIKLWAQDDIMLPDCLLEFKKFYALHHQVGFLYCGSNYIDEHGNQRPDGPIDTTPAILSTYMHAQIAYYTGSIAGNIANVCLTKAGVEKVGLFDETMKISGDFDMWVRLAEHFPTGFINKKLIKLRLHTEQLSRKKEYLINHGIEDFGVFRKLDNYISFKERKEGRKIMHINKLLSYYIIILKFFGEGDFKNGWRLYRELTSFTSFTKLSFIFFSRKLGLSKKPLFILDEENGIIQ